VVSGEARSVEETLVDYFFPQRSELCVERKRWPHFRADQGIRAVAARRLSTNIDWSTGEPSPMYGAMMN
jgi:hypothetical protein